MKEMQIVVGAQRFRTWWQGWWWEGLEAGSTGTRRESACPDLRVLSPATCCAESYPSGCPHCLSEFLSVVQQGRQLDGERPEASLQNVLAEHHLFLLEVTQGLHHDRAAALLLRVARFQPDDGLGFVDQTLDLPLVVNNTLSLFLWTFKGEKSGGKKKILVCNSLQQLSVTLWNY